MGLNCLKLTACVSSFFTSSSDLVDTSVCVVAWFKKAPSLEASQCCWQQHGRISLSVLQSQQWDGARADSPSRNLKLVIGLWS